MRLLILIGQLFQSVYSLKYNFNKIISEITIKINLNKIKADIFEPSYRTQ